ncbi:hypothetical protein ACP4OV_001914 [Aristida adscensionis]
MPTYSSRTPYRALKIEGFSLTKVSPSAKKGAIFPLQMPSSVVPGSGTSALSASAIISETVEGSHVLKIEGYSRIKGLGTGKFIRSGVFTVGGHSWYISYYPDGQSSDCDDWMSIYLCPGLLTATAEVKAKFKFSLLDEMGKPVSSFAKECEILWLALTSAVVMATASATSMDNKLGGAAGAITTISFKQYPPFVYLVGCNIIAAILEAAAIYLQVGGKGEGGDEEEGAKAPRVLLVLADVAAQALLYSSTGAVFAVGAAARASAGAGAGGFWRQVYQSKLLSLGASFAAGLAVVAKDLPLPFSLWPSSSG